MPASSTAGSPRFAQAQDAVEEGVGVNCIRINGKKIGAKPLGFFQMQALQRAGEPFALWPGHAIGEDGEIFRDWMKNHRAAEIRRLQTTLNAKQVSLRRKYEQIQRANAASAFNPPSPARDGRQNSKKFDSVTPSRIIMLTTADGCASWRRSAPLRLGARDEGRAPCGEHPP